LLLRKLLIFAVVLSSLVGCGSSNQSDFTATGVSRTNTLRFLDETPDISVDGDPVSLGRLTAYNENGEIIFGPDEDPYDEEMVFAGLPSETDLVLLEFQRGAGFTVGTFEAPVNFLTDDDGVITFNDVQPTLKSGLGDTFNVRVVNNSDYPADQVFICVLGKDAADTAFYYLDFDQQAMERFGALEQSATYSTALSNLTSEGGNEYSFQCPYDKLVSGRIYLSFGQKLQGLGLTDPNNPLGLVTPSPTGAPDAQTVFEFMELSATIGPNPNDQYVLFANTSVVDFFSVGLGMDLHYHEDNTETEMVERVGFVDNARNQVLEAFEDSSTPSEFQSYVTKDGTSDVIRVLSPVQTVSVNPNGPTASFLDSAINAGWTEYSNQVLNIPDNLSTFQYGYQYTGQLIQNDILTMTCTAKPAGDTAGGNLESLGEVCNLPEPTSRIIFFCDDDQPLPPNTEVRDTWKNDGSQGHKRLCSLLSSAMNRGVFETYSDWGDSSKFYTRPDGKYNHYSKIMHEFALDGKVYGFGYDDVYGQDPTLAEQLAKVNRVVLNIPKFPVIGQ